ncbi:hypothetical protein K2173_018793 [Erythroxylum novogranatense]|uniref:Pentatricopeptide repeat-containing protein n=1 Tax=Erythroxylum novogranatense TaxID=1862640 RepID=A0AAV8SBF3_9ROSI|nr:hypothetical protein K2173_018793 [Erythroxylum novogranatense]
MVVGVFRPLLPPRLPPQFHFPSLHTLSSSQTLEEALKATVETKAYQQIPELLLPYKTSCFNPNPFSFLSALSFNPRNQIIDEILQSLIPLRPRCLTQIVYDCLLSFTLQNPSPLPISLAILQRSLRSGCLPVPQTQLFLSSAWLQRRSQSQSVRKLLLEMQSIGYQPDCGTCNYILSSLCEVDQRVEAIKVLKGMSGAGCIPDTESYGIVINRLCRARKTAEAIELMKEMVVKVGLMPGQGIVTKLAAALRANREIWEAVGMIEFLEREGWPVGFESYEAVFEGCIECKEYVLAAKVVMGMTENGFIPYIKFRQKVVEGLAGIGEWELACVVRKRFTALSS